MLNRENIVGILLLVCCGVVAAIMIVAIAEGERPQLNLPGWLTAIIGVAFIGLLIFGFVRNRRTGGDTAWPSPMTGRKGRSLWDRLRGR